MIRIICIGNRGEESDAAGPLVHELLAERELPEGVGLVDGGTDGLDLPGMARKCRRVVFVDSVEGIGAPGEVKLIRDAAEVFGHPDRVEEGAGLAFLLSMLDQLSDGEPPEVLVVGVEPPFSEAAIWRAAEMSLLAAERESKPAAPAWQEAKERKDLIA